MTAKSLPETSASKRDQPLSHIGFGGRKSPKRVWLYDSTLRDGNQTVGVNFPADDKLKIALRLNEFGVEYIEGGWPNSSSPGEIEFFRRIKDYKVHSKIVAFGMTRKPHSTAESDENLKMLAWVEPDCVTIVGKSWRLHIEKVLETTLEENLKMISTSIRYVKDLGFDVIFDAEHFFDGFKSDPKYAMETLQAAVEAGAKEIVLCDTRGGSFPNQVYEATSEVVDRFRTRVGIHSHNDRGLATANSISAVFAGAEQVQGTINGIGERCGNANLIELVGNFEMGLGIGTGVDLKKLAPLSDYVYEIANLTRNKFQPFVGRFAFTHKAGVHGHAVLKCPEAYEFVDPTGFRMGRGVTVSSQAGLSNVTAKAQELGFKLGRQDPRAMEILRMIKRMESEGYNFENADATLALVYARIMGANLNYFTIVNWRTFIAGDNGKVSAESSVKLRLDNRFAITAEEGDGPVNAFDLALKKALEAQHPELANVKLVGYRVREINVEKGTAASVQVFIEFEGDGARWSTVGVSPNILKASEEALTDGYIYYLFKKGKKPASD